MQKKYLPSEIEKKWQNIWEEKEVYKFKEDSEKKTYYPLVELPYPSGDLHIGHWFSFGTADVHARVHRMMGENVFFTNGYDAFGLPAENAAIKRGIHPKDWTMKNIETMTSQFSTMGSMIDWSHTTAACLPEYYRWNQWIFIRMYEKGLAYRGKMLSNWCPVDQTVLANEHVENGKCWRCGSEVVQKEVEQWFIKLTALADELIWPNPTEKVEVKQNLKNQSSTLHPLSSSEVDWPVSVKVAQNQWIGKSEGAIVPFHIVDSEERIEVYTTRLDTIFGATFLVLAPEHRLINTIITEEQKAAVDEYVKQTNRKTELERKENKEKTGVFTGSYAINPFSKEKMPIWVGDYILPNYGTGAIMAVPAHDERDYAFAKAFAIPIKIVISSEGEKSSKILNQVQDDNIYTGDGVLVNSDKFSGWTSDQARKAFVKPENNGGLAIFPQNYYHIHDWSISRQRYWGTPVPMIHCDKDGIVPVPDDELPVTLPYDVDYQPKGKAPLASNEEWMKVKCPKCGGEAQRDPETLDTFFDSSWYFWRYLNPHFDKAPFDTELAKKIMPVDIYFGGAEHTLGHTLYARFFTKFFKMIGLTDLEEFALKRVQHGVILGPDGHRMSKSRGNVINPDDVVKEYGADATRLYLCFMMPYDATAPWDPNGLWGVYRFLKRVWELQEKVLNDQESIINNQLSKKDKVIMNRTIKKVGEDAGSTKFNTAVAEMMKWLNHLESKETVSKEEYENLLLILAPFAPHMTEEIWQTVIVNDNNSVQDDNRFKSIHQQSWPAVDSAFLTEDMTTVVVQINGKMRGSIKISSVEIEDKEKVIAKAQSQENISKHLEGKFAKNIVYVPGRIINFVI